MLIEQLFASLRVGGSQLHLGEEGLRDVHIVELLQDQVELRVELRESREWDGMGGEGAALHNCS